MKKKAFIFYCIFCSYILHAQPNFKDLSFFKLGTNENVAMSNLIVGSKLTGVIVVPALAMNMSKDFFAELHNKYPVWQKQYDMQLVGISTMQDVLLKPLKSTITDHFNNIKENFPVFIDTSYNFSKKPLQIAGVLKTVDNSVLVKEYLKYAYFFVTDNTGNILYWKKFHLRSKEEIAVVNDALTSLNASANKRSITSAPVNSSNTKNVDILQSKQTINNLSTGNIKLGNGGVTDFQNNPIDLFALVSRADYTVIITRNYLDINAPSGSNSIQSIDVPLNTFLASYKKDLTNYKQCNVQFGILLLSDFIYPKTDTIVRKNFYKTTKDTAVLSFKPMAASYGLSKETFFPEVFREYMIVNKHFNPYDYQYNHEKTYTDLKINLGDLFILDKNGTILYHDSRIPFYFDYESFKQFIFNKCGR